MQLMPVAYFQGPSSSSVWEEEFDDTGDVSDPSSTTPSARIMSPRDFTPGPLLPSRIIRHMALQCPEACMQAVSMKFGNQHVKPNTTNAPNQLTTSCLNTAYAVLFLFLGAKKTAFTIDTLERKNSYCFSVTTSQERTFWFTIPDLTYGGTLIQINKNKEFVYLTQDERAEKRKAFEEKNKVTNTVREAVSQALSRLPDEVTEQELQQKIMGACTSIEFNSRTMRALQREILRNRAKEYVHKEQSFIYCISIFHYNESKPTHEHICVLEQFFCPDTETTRFRLYQSWIGQATLKHHIMQRKYSDATDGSMSYGALLGFLVRLEFRYCRTILPTLLPTRPTSQKDCFGFGSKKSTHPKPYFREQTLHGISLRYLSLPCEPSSAVRHLDELIKCNADLRHYFPNR